MPPSSHCLSQAELSSPFHSSSSDTPRDHQEKPHHQTSTAKLSIVEIRSSSSERAFLWKESLRSWVNGNLATTGPKSTGLSIDSLRIPCTTELGGALGRSTKTVLEEEEEEEEEECSAEKKRLTIRRVKRIKTQQDRVRDATKVLILSSYDQQARALVALLKVCAERKDLHTGSRIHADITGTGLLEKNVFIGSALLSMYAKCGSLAKAQEVFEKLPERNVVSWTALIAGYIQHGCIVQAVKWFERMQLEGVSPNGVTLICVLKACGSIGAAKKIEELHAYIDRGRFLVKDVAVGTALVDGYAKCGVLSKAQEVFDMLPIRNVVSWNVLIAGYAQHEHGEQAVRCFEQMQFEGLSPDAVTLVYISKACGSIRARDKGKEIHATFVTDRMVKQDIVLGTALVDMYAKCGLLAKAEEVFDKLPFKDVVSWSALITGYLQHGHSRQALQAFQKMQLEGLVPDDVTLVSILQACGSLGATENGKEIHEEIASKKWLSKNVVVGTALVDMYAKCGLLSEAQQVFDKLPCWDKVSWSALIAGYAEHGYGEQALKCFAQMQSEGLSPDAVTFVCILKACATVGATEKGKEVHAEIVREGLLGKDVAVGNALIDMYVKFGLLGKAEEVFNRISVRDAVSWNTLMAGYALHGKAQYVLDMFDKMVQEGMRPDLITFTIVLNACSHVGKVHEGQMYFKAMSTGYGFTPTLEHYTCMVDIFARAGHLDKAVTLIKEMPFCADLTVWLTVLGACHRWRNVRLGRLAFEHAVRLDEKESAAYVFMSNIYVDAGRQGDADKIEAWRMKSLTATVLTELSTQGLEIEKHERT